MMNLNNPILVEYWFDIYWNIMERIGRSLVFVRKYYHAPQPFHTTFFCSIIAIDTSEDRDYLMSLPSTQPSGQPPNRTSRQPTQLPLRVNLLNFHFSTVFSSFSQPPQAFRIALISTDLFSIQASSQPSTVTARFLPAPTDSPTRATLKSSPPAETWLLSQVHHPTDFKTSRSNFAADWTTIRQPSRYSSSQVPAQPSINLTVQSSQQPTRQRPVNRWANGLDRWPHQLQNGTQAAPKSLFQYPVWPPTYLLPLLLRLLSELLKPRQTFQSTGQEFWIERMQRFGCTLVDRFSRWNSQRWSCWFFS